MAVRIQMRRDSAANWTSNDPLLAEGEMGLELDTGRWKIGNGTSPWSVLVYSNQIYSGASVITDNSASNALRITQIGSGNALIVEDSTNVDNTPFIIDSNGNVGIGTISLPNKLNVDGTISVTNINPGYNATVTSGGTLTLTNASANQQFFTGSSDHTIVLPVASTLSLGTNYKIHNNSSGLITINSSGSSLVYVLAPQVTAQITCILASGTNAASWDVDTDTTPTDKYLTTETAGATTTLTSASAQLQFFTGTLNQTLVMPVTSTMNIGMYFVINNNSTGTITIKTSNLTDIVTLPANMTINITCILNSGVTPASWDVDYSGFTNISGTGSPVMSIGSTIANATVTGQLTSTLASGTAPLVVASNTLVSNLNAQYLNGNASSFFAPISSPIFVGNPTADTAAVDTNNTQLATTAFVVGQAASATPLIDGTAAAGTSLRYARGDHVHPSGTASPIFTGNVTITDNSSSAALRITQTGSGNVLLVEDSANPDSTPFVINASGNVGIGTASPAKLLDVSGDAFIAGMTVGKGAIADVTDTIVGYEALNGVAPGTQNTALGFTALKLNSGDYNVAVGASAMPFNTTGSGNVAVGRLAMYTNTSGGSNAAFGSLALLYNTTGNWNTGVGYGALQANITANNNTAVGANALNQSDTGYDNTSIGFNSLYTNSSGYYNTAGGAEALYYNKLGANNTAFGRRALYRNTNGTTNTGIGVQALESTTTGGANAAVGSGSLFYNTTGYQNTAIGVNSGIGSSGNQNTTGANNTFIGFESAGASSTANNVITLGNSAIATLRCQVTTITSLSDARDKTDIIQIPAGLDFINRLQPVAFDWNTRDGAKVGVPDMGFIAQDLLQVMEDAGVVIPNLVSQENPDRLEAGYGTLIPILVQAIKDLSAQVKQLQEAINV